ncbi:MAG: anthranilate synthase component I family protein [Nitrospirae bacterium]|nr:anthranilate synthase component I family protein [Nitrospirota bacterium]
MTQRISPVYREVPFDSPCRVYDTIRSPKSLLFESVKGPERIARWSFICIDPYLEFIVRDGTIDIVVDGRRTVSTRKPLERLSELLHCYSQAPVPSLPPFQGGAAGLLNYDFVKYLERIPCNAVDDLGLPDAHFFMIDRLVAFDHLQQRAWVIVCPGARDTALGYSEPSGSPKEREDKALKALDAICARISAPGQGMSSETRAATARAGSGPELHYDVSREKYMTMVRQAKEYISAGDIFQTNLSVRVSADIPGYDPWDIYKVLRGINPSPFSAYADFGDYQIVSSSPERLVRVRDGIIDTRPIAGTRPRGQDKGEDDRLRAELLLNEKERAEHIMLIDLERNDIGRVARYGTVHVDELMVTEDYSHVIHIVSNVEGRLAEGKDCFDVIKAVYPGGTITGVPKVRCMEIIDELEPFRRGPYTGSLGYIGFSGTMDLNIIIRTFLVKDGRAYIQAGAGIVADSDPGREYDECIKKAEALIRTLEQF